MVFKGVPKVASSGRKSHTFSWLKAVYIYDAADYAVDFAGLFSGPDFLDLEPGDHVSHQHRKQGYQA